MPTLDQRLQVLIDGPRLRRVRESAERQGVPVGQWIRDLIDEKLDIESRGEKIREFMEFAGTMEPWPTLTQGELRRSRESIYERDLYFDEQRNSTA